MRTEIKLKMNKSFQFRKIQHWWVMPDSIEREEASQADEIGVNSASKLTPSFHSINMMEFR
jgi:hypothetical protein